MGEFRELFGDWWKNKHKALIPAHRNHIVLIVAPIFLATAVFVGGREVDAAMIRDDSSFVDLALCALVGVLTAIAVASLYILMFYGFMHRHVFDRKSRRGSRGSEGEDQ